MALLQNTTAAFCLACVLCGVLTRLVPGGSSARCIKAVAGLYILVTVLQTASGAGCALRAALPDAAEKAQPGASASSAYEENVLDTAAESLSNHCTALLAGEDIPARAEITLEKRDGKIVPAEVRIVSAAQLTAAQQAGVRRVLCPELQVSDVTFAPAEGEGGA